MNTIFWVIVLSLPILPNLWCIWHASRHSFPGPDEQKHWVRAGTFAPVIGGILYLLIGMRRARPLPKAGDGETVAETDTSEQGGTPLDPDKGNRQ